MNGRQAAKKAAARIEELEYSCGRFSSDVRAYNACIDSMIAGGSPCDWCEEKRIGECEHQDLIGKGCSDWSLRNEEEKE